MQERRAGIDCDALEADLACMQRSAQLAAASNAARQALARCAAARGSKATYPGSVGHAHAACGAPDCYAV